MSNVQCTDMCSKSVSMFKWACSSKHVQVSMFKTKLMLVNQCSSNDTELMFESVFNALICAANQCQCSSKLYNQFLISNVQMCKWSSNNQCSKMCKSVFEMISNVQQVIQSVSCTCVNGVNCTCVDHLF